MSRFVASLITDSLSRVLLVRHRNRAWELPGGHIEPGESTLSASYRECEEEAGVYPLLADRPPRVIGDCSVFFGVSEDDPEPNDPAIADAQWFSREEVRGLTLSDLPSAAVLREWAGLERAPAAVESAYYDLLATAVRAAHGLPQTATVGEMVAAVGRAQEGAVDIDAAAVRARAAYLEFPACDWLQPMTDPERVRWRRVAEAAREGMAPTAPIPEAHPAPPPGFAGSRGRVLGEAVDGAHVVRLVEYTFGDNSRVPYVELHETHDGARSGRVMALSALVHLAQNVGDSEVWAIGNREGPPPETAPIPEDVRAAAEEALGLAEKATPGPWQYSTEPHDERPDTNEVADLVNGDWVITHSELRPSDHDGRLIACARTLLPLLARAVLSGQGGTEPTRPTGVMASTAATEAMAAEIARLRADLGREQQARAHYETCFERATEEREEARAWVRRITSAERVLTCAFCGDAYPPGTPENNDAALTAHVRVCLRHPMREAERERDAARAEIASLRAASADLTEWAREKLADMTCDEVGHARNYGCSKCDLAGILAAVDAAPPPATVERVTSEVARGMGTGEPRCAECRHPIGSVAHVDCDAPALGIVGRGSGYTPTPEPERTPEKDDAIKYEFTPRQIEILALIPDEQIETHLARRRARRSGGAQ